MHHTQFTYSWMGIGMEAAQDRFDSYLATQTQEREVSPCYIQGIMHCLHLLHFRVYHHVLYTNGPIDR